MLKIKKLNDNAYYEERYLGYRLIKNGDCIELFKLKRLEPTSIFEVQQISKTDRGTGS